MSNWRDHAACRDAETLWFFPGSTADAAQFYPIAAEFCRRCPVREPCLEFAMDNREPAGMWGGLTETQRDSLRRRRQPSRSAQ